MENAEKIKEIIKELKGINNELKGINYDKKGVRSFLEESSMLVFYDSCLLHDKRCLLSYVYAMRREIEIVL